MQVLRTILLLPLQASVGDFLAKRTCLSLSRKINLYNDHSDIVTDIIVSTVNPQDCGSVFIVWCWACLSCLVSLVVGFYARIYKRLSPVETHMHAVRTCSGVIAVGRVLKTACDSGMTQQAQGPLKCVIPWKQGPWRNIALMASKYIVFTLTSIFPYKYRV